MHVVVERIENGFLIELWRRGTMNYYQAQCVFAPNEDQALAALREFGQTQMAYATERYEEAKAGKLPEEQEGE